MCAAVYLPLNVAPVFTKVPLGQQLSWDFSSNALSLSFNPELCVIWLLLMFDPDVSDRGHHLSSFQEMVPSSGVFRLSSFVCVWTRFDGTGPGKWFFHWLLFFIQVCTLFTTVSTLPLVTLLLLIKWIFYCFIYLFICITGRLLSNGTLSTQLLSHHCSV